VEQSVVKEGDSLLSKKILFLVLRIAVTAGLIAYLVLTGTISFDKIKIGEIGIGAFFLGFGLFFFIGVIGTVRWRILIAAQGIDLDFYTSFRLTFVGWFFNIAMPGSTGGDLIKAYYAATISPDKKAGAVTSVFVDRGIGLFAMVFFAFLALLANISFVLDNTTLRTVLLIVIVLLVLVALFFAVFLSRRVRHSRFVKRLVEKIPLGHLVEKVYDALFLYHSHKRAIVWAFLLSLGAHFIMVAANFCFALALGMDDARFIYFLFLIPVGTFIDAIPISIAGFGVGESAYDWLFGSLGLAVNLGAMIALLMHVAKVLWALVGAVFYLTSRKAIERARERIRQTEHPEDIIPEPSGTRETEPDSDASS
jgi:uncharacterized protein (TIRG00374 family)